MQLGLKSKNIDEMSLYKCVGDYLKSKDSKIEILSESQLNFVDLFCCLVRAEDIELKQSIDAAIKSMKDDGTLDKLTKEYITDLKSNPPPVEISKIDGADTLKIAVTGDLPPLDLVLSDGKPAGFNTAVLSEISKRINQNIEIVQVNSAARAAALTSKEVDVVFWATKPFGDKIPDDIDKPDGLELTVPYYQDDVVHIGLKK
ncbi:MAG: transporter substrate-binding domain-containing protein [Selenomonadaceae bacterium]|nr:transporter substrate-binding domain-containing protein [Selenomonadaceae bacterium]